MAILFSGMSLFTSSDIPGASLVIPAVPATGPGATPTVLMPSGPHSIPRVLVMLSMAALAELA